MRVYWNKYSDLPYKVFGCRKVPRLVTVHLLPELIVSKRRKRVEFSFCWLFWSFDITFDRRYENED